MKLEKSKEIVEISRKYVPGGVHSNARKSDPIIIIKKAQGCYFWDVDGNEYIDFHAAWGPSILGFNHPYVKEKVIEAIKTHDLYGIGTNELEIELAKRVCKHVPCAEKMLICNTGSDATYDAIRVSRAFTGRQKIIKFHGCYHGFHDYVLRNVHTHPELVWKRDPESKGMLEAAIDNTLVCRLNDLNDVEYTCKKNEGEIAAIIIEPIVYNIGCVMLKDEFLKGLRRIANENGIVLIFDEVITGFHESLGGYQAICGITPDLTTMGKAIANGFPIAALAGRADIMNRFNTHPHGDVWFSGTYNAHPAGVAAAIATLDILEKENVYEHIFSLGKQMREGIKEIINRLEMDITVAGFGSVFIIYWGQGPFNCYEDMIHLDGEKDLEFRRRMIDKGFYFVPVKERRQLFSYAHTQNEMFKALEAIEDVLKEMKKSN
jgi:glutamate-1-semialdehyde 2,1-aminomutase